jgi:hypothetical protein
MCAVDFADYALSGGLNLAIDCCRFQTPCHWVDSESQLRALAKTLEACTEFAVDLEVQSQSRSPIQSFNPSPSLSRFRLLDEAVWEAHWLF